MSISPGGQAFFALAALFTMGSLAFLVAHLLRNPDLVKAKLFLNYGRFSRFSFLALVAVAGGVAANALYTLTGGYLDASFESWGSFFRNKALTLTVFLGIGVGCLGLRKMLR